MVTMDNKPVTLTWAKNIHYSPGAKKDAIAIRRDIRRRQPGESTYIIVMPEYGINPENSAEPVAGIDIDDGTKPADGTKPVNGIKPEMYRDSMLYSLPRRDISYRIIGIAKGRREAVKLFADMIETVYKKDPALDYAEYFAAHS